MNTIAIKVSKIQKVYEIYKAPQDRLKQILFGRWKKYYQDFNVLKGISFKILRGECVGIIGKNGAGKSTLLQILTGVMTPTSGYVDVNGKVAAVLELGSGFNLEFTGRENVFLYASTFGLSDQVISARINAIEAFAGIGDFIDRPVKTYSSGMQARLAFSVIAHVDADILIIDEALSVGDAQFTQKCMKFLREFKTRGSIIFVSHDMAAVTGFCDKAIWIDDGIIMFEGSAKEACEHYYAFMQSGQLNESTHLESIISVSQPKISKTDFHIKSQSISSLNNGNLDVGVQKIESFGFNYDSKSHGTGDARILDVKFLTPDGDCLEICRGGQDVLVRINIKAIEDVDMPIVGFIIKDRLGQPLLGGNTYHTYKNKPATAFKGQYWDVEFGFKMPILAVGDYSIVAAIGNGTLEDHVHLDWKHDAFLFKVTSTSIDGVIVGVPLDKIAITTYSVDAG